MKTTAAVRMYAFGILLALVSVAASASELAYDKAQYERALAQGKPVVVDFSASWCPTCKAQKPIVTNLLLEPRFKDLTVFVADYDTEASLKKQLRITQQSTFVVFKGGQEVARSTGQTERGAIVDLFAKAL